jgi:hypothetical protein
VKTEGAEVTLGGREFETSEQEREKAWSPWVIVRNGGIERGGRRAARTFRREI